MSQRAKSNNRASVPSTKMCIVRARNPLTTLGSPLLRRFLLGCQWVSSVKFSGEIGTLLLKDHIRAHIYIYIYSLETTSGHVWTNRGGKKREVPLLSGFPRLPEISSPPPRNEAAWSWGKGERGVWYSRSRIPPFGGLSHEKTGTRTYS